MGTFVVNICMILGYMANHGSLNYQGYIICIYIYIYHCADESTASLMYVRFLVGQGGVYPFQRPQHKLVDVPQKRGSLKNQ